MVTKSTTQAWLEAAQRGEASAVSKLLAAYHPQLRSVLLGRMGSVLKARWEVDDVLQQVYLDVFRCIDSFDVQKPQAFFNWLLTIADRRMSDMRRALHRGMRDIAREVGPVPAASTCWNLLDQVYADSQTPSRAVRRDEAVDAVLACVSDLSDSHREVLTRRYLEGKSVRQVAEQMGKSEDAIVALTRRALAALRAAMDGKGDFTHGG